MHKKILNHNFSLLHVDYVQLNERWNYTNVISPYFRIYYIDEGQGLIRSGQSKVMLETAYLYIIPSFTFCHLSCDNYLSQYFIHFFEESVESISLFEYNRKVIKVKACGSDVENFRRLLEINPGRGINRSDNPKVYEKNVYYRYYQELNEIVSDAAYLETQGILLQLISRFVDAQQFAVQATGPIPSKILDAISYIQLNLKQNITVQILSQRANLHQDYFSRLFLKTTGERPLAFVHNKRIERAQYLMATSNMTYAEIADVTGFDNVQYFSKIFKKITKLTPGEYKKRNDFYR